MKSLLLGVTLGLAAALSFALEEEDITGTWHVKAVVTDKDLPEEKRPRKMSSVTVTALDRGDLEATFTFMRNDRCFQKKIFMRKMEEPGKFSTYGGRKLVYLQELPGTDHYVFYCKDQRHGGLFRMGELMGRNPDTNLEALEEFKKFVQRKGLSEGNIFMPLPMAQRPPGLHLQSPPYRQTRSPARLDLPSSHEPSLPPPA
ncbi:odorant-binding protein 2a-like [Saimiri boliviensis]|uniref:odorant-binding protein 2a-like n=1 Tax=Saimiri boliviensis TaxID=27679 RepID=UPI003D77A31C